MTMHPGAVSTHYGSPRASWSRPAALGLLLAACLTAHAAPADEIPPPARQRAERLTFDPTLDRWITAPEPIPGTEDGDLDIVRQYTAAEDFRTALKAVQRWVKLYGETAPRYSEALFLEGNAHLGLGDYRAASKAFQKLLDDYPGSPYAERALSAQFRIAEQYLAGKRRKAMWGLLRIKDRDGGIKILDDMVVNYSDTPLAEQAQLAKANYYYERGEFELAEDEYARFARDFPRSRYQPKALLWSAYSALASFPGIEFDDASLIEAEERFRQFMRSYPAHAEQLDVPVFMEQISATRADKTNAIARFYERTRQPNAARFYYRATIERWPNTPAAAEAQGRLVALGAGSAGSDLDTLPDLFTDDSEPFTDEDVNSTQPESGDQP